MKKIIVPIILFVLTQTGIQAQVKFNLDLLPDQETYLVSLLPEKDITSPFNIASNIQIVLKTPAEEPFLAGEITSQVEGVSWIDNAVAYEEIGQSDYALHAFAMVETSTQKLQFVEGVAIPLFTFKNIESGCVGTLSLPDNTDEEVISAIGKGYNFTQNITLLESRGNGYSGVLNKVASCPELSTSTQLLPINNSLKAYPIPAQNELTVEWTNPESYEGLQIKVFNALGQAVYESPLDGSIGFKQINLPVKNYAAGLYHFAIQSKTNGSQQYKFIVSKK